MAELADAYGSGPYGGNSLEVRVLSPAPIFAYLILYYLASIGFTIQEKAKVRFLPLPDPYGIFQLKKSLILSTDKKGGAKMKTIGNLLALVGLILFVYTVVGRFIGETSILGLTTIPYLGDGFTAVGMFSGIACILLLAIIAILKGE